MKQKLLETIAGFSLGMGYMESLLRVRGGEYDDRLVAIAIDSQARIVLSYADPPYRSWQSFANVVTDSADLPYVATMLDDGTILLVYTNIQLHLAFVALSFNDGAWTPGTPVTVYSGDPAASPSITVAPDDTLWISYIRISGGQQYIHVKPSTDNGQTWGSGPTSTGDQLTTALSDGNCRIVADDKTVYAVYVKESSSLVRRTFDPATGFWGLEDDIAAGTAMNADFNAAFSPANTLHVVWSDNSLKYRRHNGSFWEDVATVDADGGKFPHLHFNNGLPAVIYYKEVAPDRHTLYAAVSDGSAFLSSAPFDRQTGDFYAVLLYASSAATYVDRTDEASSAALADIYHPTTNSLLKYVDDQLFVGFDKPFRMIGFNLSTAGVGGGVSWSYWDGNNWQSFTPACGAWPLDTAVHNLMLFDDYDSIPGNWQRTVVNGESAFWIRARVTDEYSTAPIGSRLFPSVRIKALAVAR